MTNECICDYKICADSCPFCTTLDAEEPCPMDIDHELRQTIEDYLDSLHVGSWGRSFTITPGKDTREMCIDYIAELYVALDDRMDALIGQHVPANSPSPLFHANGEEI